MAKFSKKLTALLILASMLVSLLAACTGSKKDNTQASGAGTNNDSSGDNSQGGNENPSGGVGEDVPSDTPGMIFNSESRLDIVLADANLDSAVYIDFVWAIKDNLGERVKVVYDASADPAEHEIVFGETNRVVSHLAYSQLEDLMQSQEISMGGYVLYSDGSSLALAYTEELGTQHLEEIMAQMLEWASQKSLVKKRGIVSSKVYDMYEIYAAEDKEYSDAEWAALEAQVGTELTDAFREMYKKLYGEGIVSWLANLYEPRECICENYVNGVQVCLHPVDKNGNDLCKNGGFYYSNSARNTYGFLPDIESTYQALTFLEMTGMLNRKGSNFGAYLKGQLRSDIIAFTKGLQHEDGYFYHPQWTIEQSRENWERVSRDLMWATAILQKLGADPYYSTPTGSMAGTGGRPQAASTALTPTLYASKAESVSCVVATASALPAHLQSVEAFEKYLSGFKMDVYGMGYAAANELAAQVEQLTTANKRLNGALKPVLFEFFEEKHNPNNGLWREEIDYDGLNTVFKAVMVYSAFHEPFTYAEQAAQSAIYVLSSDELPGHVCGDYNTWYDIAGLIGNIRKYHHAANRGEIADGIRQSVIDIAPMAVLKTTENTLRFLKEDGSFSYFPDHCSETSQGMVVALRKNEGDVNASLICSGGMLDHISGALGVTLPSIFGTRELAMFTDIINSNTYSIKDSLPPDIIVDFEETDIDIEPKDVGVSMGSGGSAVVVGDPYNPSNKVLHFQSLAKSGTWDAVTVPNNTIKANNNCLVFDSKLMFAKEGTSQGYLIQMYIGYMAKASPYFINFTVAGEYVEIWEASSDSMNDSFNRLLGKIKLDEWFKLRIEYYFGYEDIINELTPHDTVRIKIYINEELVAVSANYMDTSMGKFTEGTGTPTDEAKQALFFPMSYFACNMYLDDLYLGYKNIEYKSEKDTEGLVINEDADAERLAHGFDDNLLPEGFAVSGDVPSKVTVVDGELALGGSSGSVKLKVPALNRKSLANVFAVGFDVRAESMNVGRLFILNLKDPYKGATIASYTFYCINENGQLYIVPLYKGNTMINMAAIPIDGESHHIEIAFFVDAASTLIYKDGVMVASTEQGIAAKHYLYEMGSAQIEYTSTSVMYIDNLYCERRVGDFEEETKPQVDRVEHNFAGEGLSGMTDVTTNGTVENGMLDISGKYLNIKVNNRSPYVSAYQLHMNVDTVGSSSGSTSLSFLDSNGALAAGIVMEENDGVIYLYEVLRGGKYGECVASFKYNGRTELVVNLYDNEKVLEVYANGELKLVTGVFNSAEYEKIAEAYVTSTNAKINNLYFEGVTLTYSATGADAQTKDDTDEVITYEYSSVGNYPNRITVGSGISESSAIEYIERDGSLTKVLAYKKTLSGNASGVRYKFADEKAYTSVVFETDIMLAGGFIAGDWKSNFDLLFSTSSGGTHMFYVQFRVTNGRLLVNLYDGVKQLTKYDCGAISKDEWINIRAEVDAGDRTTNEETGARIVIYVNDIEVYNGNEFVGSSKENAKTETGSVYQVMFLPLKDVTGTIYLDNTSLKHN